MGEIKIIVVDDEDIISRFIEKFLVLSGFSCRTFTKAEDALAFFKKEVEISLAIIDLNLETMNGLELAQQFRSIHKNVKILITSGNHFELENIQSKPEIDGILKKPFTLEDLRHLLQKLLV